MILPFSFSFGADDERFESKDSKHSISDSIYKEAGMILDQGKNELALRFARSLQESVRRFNAEVSYNQGFTEHLELYAKFSFEFNHFISSSPQYNKTNKGPGDLVIGGKYSLINEKPNRPNITLILQLSAPTRKSTSDVLRIGKGTWGGGFSVMGSKTLEPVAVFASLGYDYVHSLRLETGVKEGAKHSFTYEFGMGFAVNESVTTLTAIGGSFTSSLKYDGAAVLGSEVEQITFRNGINFKVGNSYIGPSVIILPSEGFASVELVCSTNI